MSGFKSWPNFSHRSIVGEQAVGHKPWSLGLIESHVRLRHASMVHGAVGMRGARDDAPSAPDERAHQHQHQPQP